MKLPRFLLLSCLAFAYAGQGLLNAAETAKTAAGYWEGAITLPNAELPIRVELTTGSAGAWQGTIDMPRQGLRGFVLAGVKVSSDDVAFDMPGLPGDPHFGGKLAPDGATIAGEMSQGGTALPFRLERKTKPAPTADENAVPAKGVVGQGLAGKWRGSIKPIPGVELRLDLELKTDDAGKIAGEMISLDQGSPRIALGTITEKDGAVQFDTPRINGSFSGKFNADGSELAGEWTQGGRAMPLVFKRLPVKN